VALAMLAPLAIADNYPRQRGIDVQHYVFRVTLSDESDEITGETTVSIRFLKAGLARFTLDLAAPAGGKGMTVTDVTSAGEPLKYSHENDRLTIMLNAAPEPNALRQYTVKYHGIPADGLKFPKNKFGERTFFSVNWPDKAHQWLPTVDHPYDKATSEFIVTAPAKYQVVANGVLDEQMDLGDGRRMTHWKQSVPIATWLNNIGVAQFASRNFAKAAGVPLQSWLFHQDREKGIGTFEEPLRESIEFFNDHVGPYPYEKLAAVEAAGMGGGMEHASEIFFGENAVRDGRPALGLVSHETAHQWFGDSVTESDWDDVWLSEGFATYFSALAIEHFEGRDAFLRQMKATRPRIFAAEKRLPDTAVVQTKAWEGIPNGIVYQKGGWSLHMLRGEIGTDKFWAGIREYYRRYRDANATTADFEKVMEETSGEDLRWFFQQWIYRAGSPVVTGAWHYEADVKKVRVELTQTEPGEPYRLPIEIGITSAGAPEPKITRVDFHQKQQGFEIPADREPAAVELDPNVWLLIDGKIEKK
jgi:aminopeptidase N